MIRIGVWLLFWLLGLPLPAQTPLPDETQDINEVTLAGEMIRLDNLVLAEDLLQTYGWRWKFRNYETVYYTRIGNYRGSAFRIVSVSEKDRRLQQISFTTTTHPKRLIDSMRRIGFKMKSFKENTAYFEQVDGDQKATLEVDVSLPAFSMVFYVR